jgi:hypothetical protein
MKMKVFKKILAVVIAASMAISLAIQVQACEECEAAAQQQNTPEESVPVSERHIDDFLLPLNSEFSYDFELFNAAGAVSARGVVEGKGRDITVLRREADGTYTEQTDSQAMQIARQFRMLTAEDVTEADFDGDFPAMFHNSGTGLITAASFASGRVSVSDSLQILRFIVRLSGDLRNADGEPAVGTRAFNASLVTTGARTAGRPSVNDALAILRRIVRLPDAPGSFADSHHTWEYKNYSLTGGDDRVMNFVFDKDGVVIGVHFNGIFNRISNLRAELSGETASDFTRKTQLWWIIDSARGNGEFSFEFEDEAGTVGRIVGKDGDIGVYARNADGTYTDAGHDSFTDLFALLTQGQHNHNQPDREGHYGGEFPAFFGEPVGGVWTFENFPLMTAAALDAAANRFNTMLPPTNLEPDNFMLFVHDAGGTGLMRGLHFRGAFMKISNLTNTVGEPFTVVEPSCDECGCCEDCGFCRDCDRCWDWFGCDCLCCPDCGECGGCCRCGELCEGCPCWDCRSLCGECHECNPIDREELYAQLWDVINSARGDGDFSFEFALAPNAAGVQTRGVVESNGGDIRVFHINADGEYIETTNSAAMTMARNLRLLTANRTTANAPGTPGYFDPANIPEFVGRRDRVFVNYAMTRDVTLNSAEDRFDTNLAPANTREENYMMFIFCAYEGELAGIRYRDGANNVFFAIENLKPELYDSENGGIIADDYSRKTQLWWIIDAARGNGQFSFEFALAPNASGVQTRGVIEGDNGDIRVYHRSGDEYIETTNSAMMTMARYFRLLTQGQHNHNQPDREGHLDPETFPEWLTDTFEGAPTFENFPLMTDAALNTAQNRFATSMAPLTLEEIDNFMLFIHDAGGTGEMRGVHFRGTFIAIENLKPELYDSENGGIIADDYSRKTQLWWIIDAARGNGQFSFDFELEDGATGTITGDNGNVEVALSNENAELAELLETLFAANFALLTQGTHNHNQPTMPGHLDPATFPEWLGEANGGDWTFENFPLMTAAALAAAQNRYATTLPPTNLELENFMLFIHDAGGTGEMRGVHFGGTFMAISNLTNSIG